MRTKRILRVLKNPCNIYFTFWCLYLLQGTLYPSGTLLSQIFLIIILGMSLLDIWKVKVNYMNKRFFKGLCILLFMFVIYGLVLFITDGKVTYGPDELNVATSRYLKLILMSLLPIYTCYKYTLNGKLRFENYRIWVFVFLIVAICEFFSYQRSVLLAMMEEGSQRDGITNNAGYIILSIFPLAYLFDRKPAVQYLLVGVCSVFIIAGMKRGAILILAVLLIIFGFYKLANTKTIGKIGLICALLVIVGVLYHYVGDLLDNNAYFQTRLESTLNGDTSGRDSIYGFFWRAFIDDANIVQKLIGRGAHGTVKLYGNFAHNDWLEILTNQGLVGLSVYLYFWSGMFVFLKRQKNKLSRIAFASIAMLYFLKSVFSMSIDSMTIYSSSFIGYCLADGFIRDRLYVRKSNGLTVKQCRTISKQK